MVGEQVTWRQEKVRMGAFEAISIPGSALTSATMEARLVPKSRFTASRVSRSSLPQATYVDSMTVTVRMSFNIVRRPVTNLAR